jgi:putative ABC transport system ATP-binding protein
MSDVDAQRPIVRCQDLTRVFHQGPTEIHALRGVTLDLHSGELTLIVGPSGCGKTTLLTIVAGMLAPTSGTVEVLGESLEDLSPAELTTFRGERLGFVFQQYNLLPSLTVAENVCVPLLVAGRSKKNAIAHAIEVLDQVGLKERVHAFPRQLSGGQQQRVAIARAIVHQPELIVCDEPTAALDAHTGSSVMKLLRDVAVQSNRGVIVVTHDPRVVPFADRVVLIEDGRVTKDESDPTTVGLSIANEPTQPAK